MNILVVTPFYKIEGRETLKRGMNAIHYLVKYWNDQPDVNIRVVCTYLNAGRNIKFLFNKGELRNYLEDYEYETDGVPVYLTEVQQIPFQTRLWGFQNKKIIRAINTVAKKYDFVPDVIVTHFPIRYAFLMNKLPWNCPKTTVLHMTDAVRLKKHTKLWKKAIPAAFDKIYCRSLSIKRQCEKFGLEGVSDFIVSSGVPYSENTKPIVRQTMNGTIHLLYVGELLTRKHADYVLYAINECKDNYDFELTIIGKGVDENRLKELVKTYQLEDKVKFIQSVPHDDVYKHMQEADVFIMPSTGETLGLVYLEAIAQGCITVGTEDEGIDGIIENGKNGFLVKPNDPDSVTEVLRKIAELTDSEVERISKAAIETARYYNEEDMSLRYLEEIKRVVSKGSSD